MRKLAYFDNAATTFPKPEIVYNTMDVFYRNIGVNVGRGQYPLADEATAKLEYTRLQIRSLFHAPTADVVFTPSATIALNMVIQGLDWSKIKNVYITPFEHNGVLRVLNYLQLKYKFNLFQIAVDPLCFNYNLKKITSDFLCNNPNLILMTQVSNVCGLITPISEIVEIARKYKSIIVVDTAQGAGLINLDIVSEGIDYTIFAGHKALFGPLGVGGFVINGFRGLKPIIYGGTGVDSRNPYMPDLIPARFEPASMNIQAIAGLSAALEWVSQQNISNLRESESKNREKLISLINSCNDFHIIGFFSPNDTVGVISCIVDGYSPDEAGLILGKRGVAVRTGLHCAPIAHRFLGTFPAGTVRFSCSALTTNEEFEILAEVLRDWE